MISERQNDRGRVFESLTELVQGPLRPEALVVLRQGPSLHRRVAVWRMRNKRWGNEPCMGRRKRWGMGVQGMRQ